MPDKYNSTTKSFRLERMQYTVFRNDSPYCASESPEVSSEIASKLQLLENLKTALNEHNTEQIEGNLELIKNL